MTIESAYFFECRGPCFFKLCAFASTFIFLLFLLIFLFFFFLFFKKKPIARGLPYCLSNAGGASAISSRQQLARNFKGFDNVINLGDTWYARGSVLKSTIQ